MRRKAKAIGAAALALAMVTSAIPFNSGLAAASSDYMYDDSYSLGWNNGIAVYKGGTASQTVAESGIPTYAGSGDNPFGAEIEQAWDADSIILTRPVQYTTADGEVHDVESMLTNFDFIADPTAIDNTAVDGKLYVYGTTEGIDYKNGNMADNGYNNHSLTILSTSDMVNWTDEGFCDTQNLTNEPSYSETKETNKWASKAWAPSGLAFDGDGDGQDEYYLFHTNSGAVGYVMSDSPTGPWRDPLKKTMFAGISGVKWCFDPAVLRDDKGDAYVYFGGGCWNGSDKEIKDHPDGVAHPKTGRVCKLKFNENGEAFADGDPQEMDTFYLFEDSEINQFNGKYYYSYCVNFSVPASEPLVKSGSIAVYVSSDPMNIAFDPYDENGNERTQYTDDEGVYHHFLGTILDNPSVIYGQSYNNHHHMQSYKGHDYIFYHSTVLNNSLHRESHQYRNLHVDEIKIDAETDEISIDPSYEGAKQIENFNPYVDIKGNVKYINATTTSYSAGVKSSLSDEMTLAKNNDDALNNGSPMVLDEINTGDWTKIQGVDLGNGPVKFETVMASETDMGAIEVFIDDPTKAANRIATVNVRNTGDQDNFDTVATDITGSYTGVHDLYFVFRGEDYRVAAWKFTENPVAPATPTPTPTATVQSTPTAAPTQAPTATAAPATDYSKTYSIAGLNYKISEKGTATVKSPVKKTAKSYTIPAAVKVDGKSYKVTGISAGAFKGCKKLASVTIGSNVKAIGANAFNGCPALKKITVKSAVISSVGKNAFKGTNKKLTVKAPKKCVAKYKKTFKGKGQKVRVK